MAFLRLRRALFAAACATSLALAACGGGDVVSEFKPQRMVAFGDHFSDVGQRGVRYTINNGVAVNWTERLASAYGLSLLPTAAGGTSYATGTARVTIDPDAQGNTATPTVTEQITAFLAAGGPQGNDLIVVGAGGADLIAEMQSVRAGTQTGAQAQARARQAGTQLGEQVRRLVQAGAKHVLVAAAYNHGRSPWGIALGQQALLEAMTTNFNDGLKISMVDLGQNVLFVDTALYINLVTASPSGYGYTDVNTVFCTTIDPGIGVGIGPNQVSSLLCNGATLANANAATGLFADPVNFTPAGHSSIGQYAYERSKDRW